MSTRARRQRITDSFITSFDYSFFHGWRSARMMSPLPWTHTINPPHITAVWAASLPFFFRSLLLSRYCSRLSQIRVMEVHTKLRCSPIIRIRYVDVTVLLSRSIRNNIDANEK